MKSQKLILALVKCLPLRGECEMKCTPKVLCPTIRVHFTQSVAPHGAIIRVWRLRTGVPLRCTPAYVLVAPHGAVYQILIKKNGFFLPLSSTCTTFVPNES